MPTSGMPWVKVYTEFLDDPKVGFVDELSQLLLVKLFLLAGECDAEGYLANGESLLSKEQVAWRVRLALDEFRRRWDVLEAAGFVAQEDDGALVVCRFHVRQGRSQSEKREQWRERKQRQREKEAGPAADSPDCPEGVTGDSSVTHATREEKRRVEKSREEKKTEGADAPSTPPATLPPATLDGWIALLEQSTNRTATLRWAFEVLFPGRSPPDYAYIGRVARTVGGAGRLVDLLWRAVPAHPTGDILRYVQGIAKHQGRVPPDESSALDGWVAAGAITGAGEALDELAEVGDGDGESE